MPCCVAMNCSNRDDKGYRLYKIPADKARRLKWIQSIRRQHWTPTKSSRLCEIHFEDSQFESNRKDDWKKLKPNAVPTLFDIPNPPPKINPPARRSLYKNPRTHVSTERKVDNVAAQTNVPTANCVKLQSENECLQEQVPQLLENGQLRKEIESLRIPTVASSEEENVNLRQQIDLLQDTISRLKKENTKLQNQVESLTAKLLSSGEEANLLKK